jgi:ribosomal protein S18 acetylase RimI-like enzyme
MLVRVTHLHQNAPGELTPPEAALPGPRLVQQIRPCPGLARYLYVRIGRSCGWSSRLGWSDEQWAEWLARPEREFWFSWRHDERHEQLTGFVELWLGQAADRTATYIKFLGLLPEHRGLGLGSHLVAQATRRAWTAHRRAPWLPRVERVFLETRDLDSPHALHNYLARGFRIERQECEDHPVTGAEPPRTSAGTAP